MASSEGSQSTTYEHRGQVAWLTINRPDNRNALSRDVREGLWEGFRRFATDDDARVLVVTGAGDRVFCAGGDLNEISGDAVSLPPPDFIPTQAIDVRGQILGRNIEIEKPVIAAVNGAAYAGGFLLAQSCDLCVAASHARFAIPEGKVGRGASWASALPWLIPPRVALEMLLTGDPIDAARAHEVGLVNRVVDAADLQTATQELAERIAANAPLSLRAMKQTVYATAGLRLQEALEAVQDFNAVPYSSEDAQEGPRAFLEKRLPVWKGR